MNTLDTVILTGSRRPGLWRGMACVATLLALCTAALSPWTTLWPSFATDAVANVILLLNAFFVGSICLGFLLTPRECDTTLSSLEWLFLALALGLGLFSWVMLPAGLVLPYNRLLYRIAHGVVLGSGSWWWYRSGLAQRIRSSWKPIERPSTLEMALWTLILLSFGYVAFLLLHGIEGSDAQTQHLYSVLAWEDARRFEPMVSLSDRLPYSMTSAQPLGGRLLLLHVDLLGSIFATGAFNIVTMVVACLGVVALGGVIFGQPVGRLAGLIYLTSPVLFRMFMTDVSDYFINLLLFLAVCASLALAIESRSRGWVRVMLLTSGLLCGVKYYGLIELGVLLPIATVLLYRRRMLGMVAVSWPLFALAALPWVLHHWIFFGDPVWPYWIRIFRGVALTRRWQLYFDTYVYGTHGIYLSVPGTSFASAHWQYLVHELFPPVDSHLAFSPLFMPAIAYWCVAAFRDRRYLIPLLWTAGFLAVTLNSLLYNKYMFLLIGPTAPFIALPMWRAVAGRPALASAVHGVLGIFVLLVFWQPIQRGDLDRELMTVRAEHLAAEPLKTLNALPSTARVFGNIEAMDVRYQRISMKFHLLTDLDELLCDDWRRLFAIYHRQGVTHYLVQDKADRYPYENTIPIAERYDPALAASLRDLRITFERNRQVRDEYLRHYGKLTQLGSYRLYELTP